MAFYQIQHFSKELGMNVPLSVVLPDEIGDKKIKTLYLLHGMSDNHLSWLINSRVKSYAHEYNLALVMPSAQLSFYTDMDKGFKFFSYIAEELPVLVERMFPSLDRRKESRFVAGLSMGGYGALKLILRKPDSFCKAFCFSSAIDMKRRLENISGRNIALFRNIFGEEVKKADDLFSLARSFENKEKPSIYMSCGRLDSLLMENRRLFELLKSEGFDVKFYEEENIGHSWAFWDSEVKKACDFIGGID